MGDGMAKYIQQDVDSIADYDEYCHFVAGLVGVGLSQVIHKLLPLRVCCQDVSLAKLRKAGLSSGDCL